jgi:hypothetical protein
MTLNERRRLRISLVACGLFVVGALNANRIVAQGAYNCLTATSCTPLTLTANVQLTNLHPAVTHVQFECTGTMSPSGEIYERSNQMPVVNRGYTGSLTATMNVPRFVIAAIATHAIPVSCKLQLVKGAAVADAVASAAAPQGVLDSNWGVLATGATVTWKQTVMFPNTNMP